MQHVWSTYLEAGDSNDDVASILAKRFTRSAENDNSLSHRRQASAVSQAYSVASSNRHLTDHALLEPTSNPLTSPGSLDSVKDLGVRMTPSTPSFNGLVGPGLNASSSSTPLALSINYLPTKFSRPLSPSGIHKRKNAKGTTTAVLPKQGGGREAFKSGESRMPGDDDEDYDGVNGGIFAGRKGRRLRWNKFKIILFVMNSCLSIYSVISLIFCILTYFNVWTHADVVRVSNTTELIISTIASSLGIVTSLIGWSGILLNNRSFLAVYTLMLWFCFAFLVTPGYITYKQRTFNLEGKINALWSQKLGLDGRMRVQNQLMCCGYFSPFVEATVSQDCYARSILPGCKADFLQFERMVLERWYTVSFALVPLHIGVIVAALLCSNHVTYRFGKGMTPKAYRLSLSSMAVIMDSYANQLAEQLGPEAANDLLSHSKSNLHLDVLPTMPYTSNPSTIASRNANSTINSINSNTPLVALTPPAVTSPAVVTGTGAATSYTEAYPRRI